MACRLVKADRERVCVCVSTMSVSDGRGLEDVNNKNNLCGCERECVRVNKKNMLL